ncbi:MAG: DEAD/DEAH box helicase [Candidatus Njordarchaeum guaymaensis]
MSSEELLITKGELELILKTKNESFFWSLASIFKEINQIKIDLKTRTFRALPFNFWMIIEFLKQRRIPYKLFLNVSFDLDFEIVGETLQLRPYQEKLVSNLEKSRYQGVIVLPTGAGKTILALKLIEKLKVKTLIVVPTIDLLTQWKEKITNLLKIDENKIGIYGGGIREWTPILITTYQSACKVPFLRRAFDYFGLVIFDEVHHLVAETYIEIAKRIIAPFRVGLTATPKRADQREELLDLYVGPILWGEKVTDLISQGYLADFDYVKKKVPLNPEEKERYLALISKYTEYIRSNFPKLKGKLALRRVIFASSRDPEAREALKARQEARKIAFSSTEKIKLLNEILIKHKRDKVLIFTKFVETAKKISYLFGIPVITHDTAKKERNDILKLFKEGKITKLVSAEALDEGIDVPDASVAIILSGTASERQIIQRIGRVLRPRPGKKAVIYELITAETYEEHISRRRRRAIF